MSPLASATESKTFFWSLCVHPIFRSSELTDAEQWAPQDYTDRFLNEPDSLDGILTGMATDYASHRAIISALQAVSQTVQLPSNSLT